jgi:hypothetical protein
VLTAWIPRNGGVARLYAARLALSLPKLWKDARRLEETDDAEPLILDWFKDAVASAHYSLRSGDFARSLAVDATDEEEVQGVTTAWVLEDAERELHHGAEDFQMGDFRQAWPIAREILTKAGMELKVDEREHDLLCRRIMLALGEIHGARLRWAQGDLSFEPPLPSGKAESALLLPTSPAPDAVPETGVTLAEAIETVLDLRQRERPTSKKNVDQFRAELKILTDFFGSDRAVSSIKRMHVGELFTAFRFFPPKFRAHPDLLGLSIAEVAAEARVRGLPPMNSRTQMGYFGTFRVLFRELMRMGQVEADPFETITIRHRESGGSDEGGFEDVELEKIFS